MRKVYPEIRDLGGEVLAISFFPPARVAAFYTDFPLPFATLSDPDRTVYRALGLEKTSWKTMLRPGIMLAICG